MAAHCAHLEEEIRTLRRSIRVLSAKHASIGCPYVRRERPRWRSRIAQVVAVMLTVVLTYLGWSVDQRRYCCLRAGPPESSANRVFAAFAGFRR